MKRPSRQPWTGTSTLALAGLLALVSASSPGQDGSGVRINEILTSNNSRPPKDSQGKHHDLLELYNSGEQAVALGGQTSDASYALSDTPDLPAEALLFKFKGGGSATIPAKGFLTIFLDNPPATRLSCEIFTGFGVARDGSEPITLWGPVDGVDAQGNPTRPMIDQVFLPPLESDESFGRFPDGAGPAPVPLAETLQHLHINPPATSPSTLGTCDRGCPLVGPLCSGEANGRGGNRAPFVNRVGHSSNHPLAGEPVEITARVEDDKDPLAPNIAQVLLEYSVDGDPQPGVSMVVQGAIHDASALGRPLERWSLWKATIPGQPAGALVEFALRVQDIEGLSSTDPAVPCAAGTGPCDDLGLPGPGCIKEPSPGLRYLPCSVPFRYLVGFEAAAPYAKLVINEVVASQTKVLPDPSEPTIYDDFIELYNGSGEVLDLSGLWLSDKAFQPLGWSFPAGAAMEPGEYLIIWTDSDGGKCPRPPKVAGDGQECPDPTSPSLKAYHTNFSLDTDRDEVYLFDRAERRHGVLSGVEFESLPVDMSFSRLPDGDPVGSFEVQTPTPGAPNGGPEASRFLRGDTDGSCTADISDAIVTLNYLFQGGKAPYCLDAADSDDNGSIQLTDAVYLLSFLFQGGPAPPAPGTETAGPDPTEDGLIDCGLNTCL